MKPPGLVRDERKTTIDYFKGLAADLRVPCQTLINMYLRDCAASRRKPAVKWIAAAQERPTMR